MLILPCLLYVFFEFSLLKKAEYEFPHVCHLIPPKATAETIAQIYQKCAEKIDSNKAESSIFLRFLISSKKSSWNYYFIKRKMDVSC